jgi:hypothetical protein
VLDPSGHRWALATKTEDLSADETRERGDTYLSEHPDPTRPNATVREGPASPPTR